MGRQRRAHGLRALEPLLSGGNDLVAPRLEYPAPGIGLLAGDLRLAVLEDEAADPGCIGVLGHFRSLMHLAQEAQKPLFDLKPGDGVFGGHTQAVMDSCRDFRELARAVSRRTAA